MSNIQLIKNEEEKYDEIEHSCLICQETLSVPIIIKIKNCICNYTLCLSCFRSSMKLNKKNKIFNNIFDKCLICKTEFKINRDIICFELTPSYKLYEIDLNFSRYLDKKYGVIQCRYPNCKWEGSRINFISNHSKNCNHLIISCNCGHSYKQKNKNNHLKICPNYILNCPGCAISLPRKHIHNHMLGCNNVYVICNQCNTLIKRKDIKYHACVIDEIIKSYTNIQQLYNNLLIKVNDISDILITNINKEFDIYESNIKSRGPLTTNISEILQDYFSEHDSLNTLF